MRGSRYALAGSGARRALFTLGHAVWRAARLNRAVDAVLGRLRAPARRWVEGRRTALRVWAGWTCVPSEELERTYRDCLALLAERVGKDELGDYLEFGVFYGNSLLGMQKVSTEAGLTGMRLVGFDSFEGLPEGAEDETEGMWKQGEFHAPLERARRHLTARGADWDRITLVRGWFDDTLTPETAGRLGLEKASVIMVGCDLYASTVPCLRFAGPLIRDEAVIVFDDWHSGGLAERREGERRAFEEFLAATPEIEVVGELEPYNDTSAVFHVRRLTAGSC